MTIGGQGWWLVGALASIITPIVTALRGAIATVIGTGGTAFSGPVNTVAPVVSGTRGGTLSCTTGTWTGSPAPTFSYQWQAAATLGGGGSFASIAGATASTFNDGGTSPVTSQYDVRCVVTATNAVTVVAANSNTLAAWTLAAVVDKRLWLKAGNWVLDGSSNVQTWTDLAGFGDATQASSGNRPTPTTLSGQPALQFTANTDQLVVAHRVNLRATAGMYWFHIFKTATAGAFKGLSGKWTATGALADWAVLVTNAAADDSVTSIRNAANSGNYTVVQTDDPHNNVTHLLQTRWSGSVLGQRQDAGTEITVAAADSYASGAANVAIGGYIAGTLTDVPEVTIAEVLCCVPTAPELVQIRLYFSLLYGVST